MQLVLSNNRIIAHGENFLALGGVVINTETGTRYDNATIAECEGCPSDIDKVGYEYHAGVFVPCAPFGVGNNNGYFMEVCESCATPRSSGIPIKGGLRRENLSIFPLLWENASPDSSFTEQTIEIERAEYVGVVVVVANQRSRLGETQGVMIGTGIGINVTISDTDEADRLRTITVCENGIKFSDCKDGAVRENAYLIPLKIYGVKL
jgi:hypothetical protein